MIRGKSYIIMTEKQRLTLASCYQQLFMHGYPVDNDVSWLLVLGLIETYEIVMKWHTQI